MNGSAPLAAKPTGRCSRIAGTGGYLPAKRLTNGALADRLASHGVETSDDWIVERTGIRARHFAADGEMCSDLALVAAQRALEILARQLGGIVDGFGWFRLPFGPRLLHLFLHGIPFTNSRQSLRSPRLAKRALMMRTTFS